MNTLEALQRRIEILESEQEAFVTQISDCFEEANLFRKFSEQLDIRESATDLSQTCQNVLPQVAHVVKAEAAVFVLDAEVAQSLSLCVGESETWLDHQRRKDDKPHRLYWSEPFSVNSDVCRRLIEQFEVDAERQAVVRNWFHESLESADFPGVRDFIMTPIAKAGQRMGWMVVFNRIRQQAMDGMPQTGRLSQYEFGSIEVNVLICAANMLATHLRNIEQFREKEKLLINMVRVLVSAIEAKDEYTSGHSERVALYGKRLAQELGFSTDKCERLFLTGLVHDIGKIGVQGSTLRKPECLTREELVEVQQHPDVGWRILQELDQLGYVLPGVVFHHEHYDGKGYPDGLSGEEIPYDARILAVADSYDAMTSDRPYREGMPTEEAIENLFEGAGKQWDPEIVETFLRILPDILQIQENYVRSNRRHNHRRQTNVVAAENITLTSNQTPLEFSPTFAFTTVNNSAKPPSRGHSLMEMVIVLMVGGILAVIAAPKFLESLATRRIEAAAKRIQSDLELVRHHAIATSSQRGASFDKDHDKYVLYPEIADLNHPTKPYTTDLSFEPYCCDLIHVDFGGDHHVVFNGYGIPNSGGTIVIRSGKNVREISLDAATGAVLLVDVNSMVPSD